MGFSVHSQWQVRDERGRRKYLNGEERRRFLSAAGELNASSSAFCRLLAQAGCRVSEGLEIDRDRLDVDQCAVTFRTLKRRRIVFRSVPVPETLMFDLLALASHRSGNIWSMHRSTAWRLITAMMADAEIEGPMACCKGLRHGFGMHAIAQGVPAHLIQRWLGHASPSTTAIYLDAVGVEERKFAARMWT
jgi:integrase